MIILKSPNLLTYGYRAMLRVEILNVYVFLLTLYFSRKKLQLHDEQLRGKYIYHSQNDVLGNRVSRARSSCDSVRSLLLLSLLMYSVAICIY